MKENIKAWRDLESGSLFIEINENIYKILKRIKVILIGILIGVFAIVAIHIGWAFGLSILGWAFGLSILGYLWMGFRIIYFRYSLWNV